MHAQLTWVLTDHIFSWQKNKAVVKAQAAAQLLEQEVKSLEEAIMAVGGVRLRSQKSKVEGLKEQIDTLQVREGCNEWGKMVWRRKKSEGIYEKYHGVKARINTWILGKDVIFELK